jgi:hypothetical protein
LGASLSHADSATASTDAVMIRAKANLPPVACMALRIETSVPGPGVEAQY